jgi:hypothetical protein
MPATTHWNELSRLEQRLLTRLFGGGSLRNQNPEIISRLLQRELDDRFHKTDHNSTFVESDQARISQGHLTTSVPANIRFEPRKRPTSRR